MNVRIPFKVSAESMQSGNHAAGQILRFVSGAQPLFNRIGCTVEKHIQKISVFPEKESEFLCDGKNDMPMITVNQFGFNFFSPKFLVLIPTTIANPALASERHNFPISTNTLIQRETLFDITTINDLTDFKIYNIPHGIFLYKIIPVFFEYFV